MDGKITSQKFEYMDGPERKDLLMVNQCIQFVL